MPSMKKKETPAAVSYASALGQPAADRRIEILRRIAQSGSISQAAREAGVSYKAAWQAIDTLTNLAGATLVHRDVGGAGGGGASLSDAGRRLLEASSQLEQARSQVLQRLQSASPELAGAASASRLALRTSMRNQLPCRVKGLATTGQMVWVTLELGEGALLTSRITVESAELLALRPGLAVLALCKATAVQITRQAGPGAPAPGLSNVLAGRAARASRGKTGDEISVTLEGGLRLVGFARPGSGIRAGSKVHAVLDESAVVVALGD
jgi:molybdate transport system regulatory protein